MRRTPTLRRMNTRAKKAKGARVAKAKERPIEVKIDPKLAAAWKKCLAVLQTSSIGEADAWDRKYETVGQIIAHDPPLYLAGGMSTQHDFFAKYLPGEPDRSILRNVRIAQYASPQEEAAYTTSKIDAAITYLEAKNGKSDSGRIPVDFAKLRVQTKGGAVRFADATVQQVREAARLAQRSGTRGGAAKKASPVVAALVKLLPADAKDVTLHYADGRVTVGRVPVRLFVEVMRALAKAKVPLSSG
jgi:hypothetical protein